MKVSTWEISNVAKSFPGVRALKGVDMTIKGGHIHALIGENGCGKSTLIKILAGVHRSESGEIRRDGQLLDFIDPVETIAAGVTAIWQEFSLVP